MKLDFKSLKVRSWLYFIIFTAVILAVIWLLHIIFFNTFYRSMKINEIVRIGNTIEESYDHIYINRIMNEFAFENNLFIIIYDEDANVVKSSDMFGEPSNNRGPRLSQPFEDFAGFKQRLLENEGESTYHIVGDPKMERLFYGSVFTDTAGSQLYLFIVATLPTIEPAIEILKTQFMYITIILFLLGFLVAYAFSKHFSNSIVNLTQTAKQLANGNLDVVFEKGSYSEINQLAGALNYATEEMSRVDVLRKDLIANISHDLRTPLTIIKFYAEMIKDISGDNPKKRSEHAELIMKESDRLASLVNSILELSQAQSEKLELHCKTFNLSDTVCNVIARFHALAERDGYIFIRNIDEDLYINADEEQIERVLYNLISNAVNHTGTDKNINVKLKAYNNKVRFEVTDTGDGIPEDQLQSIWERYYKAKATRQRAVVGSGLGLSIVKQVLKQHNAAFGAHSVVGQGSTFWFELEK